VKLAIWSSFFFDETPEGMVAALARAGWRYSELSDEHSRMLLARGKPEAEGRRFAAFAAEHGVAFTQGHLDLPCDIAPGDEPARRRAVEGLKPWFDLYQAAGVTAGVLHPGGGESEPGQRHAERLRSLAEIDSYLAGSGLVICIENCSSGAALVPLMAETDPARFAVCLDTGHLNVAGEPQAAFIEQMGPRLKALHLAENGGKFDEHAMPYARGGTVPWAEVAAALRQVGYRGLLNFEIPGETRCPLPVRRIKLDYLKALAEHIFAS
jgi:sugar phosphate isomerase/epimerase